jgi:hypothetical protein
VSALAMEFLTLSLSLLARWESHNVLVTSPARGPRDSVRLSLHPGHEGRGSAPTPPPTMSPKSNVSTKAWTRTSKLVTSGICHSNRKVTPTSPVG